MILLSSEINHLEEASIVNELLSEYSNFRFHLRKPNWSRQNISSYIDGIKPCHYSRISVHVNEPFTEYNGLKIHHSEKNRTNNTVLSSSTSFHFKNDAVSKGHLYDYFFCSPVLKSISKQGHESLEGWNIRNQNDLFRSKAVALGGISVESIDEIVGLGFKHAAVLGAIWNSGQPITSFKNILKKCQQNDLIV